MRGLAGKAFVVAGGGGIGGSTVRRLVEEGAKVALGDIDMAAAATLVAQLNGSAGQNAIACRCDISSEAEVAALVAAAIEAFGQIDGLFANAADLGNVLRDKNVLSTPLEVFDRTIQVNLRGHVICTRAVLPELLKRGGGAIVYTASEAALDPLPEVYAYSSAKGGLFPLARHVAKTWGVQGIRANVVSPGAILTETVKQAMPAAEVERFRAAASSARLGMPEDIAAMVAFLLSDDAEFVNGQTISVNGGSMMR